MTMKTDNRIKLRDGRVLGYAEYGVPTGQSVLHFHGTPSSRLEFHHNTLHEVALQHNAHMIAIDRPGIGLSDFKPCRTIGDWPSDVVELAERIVLDGPHVLALVDGLNLERFAILAYSLGGPYRMACAFAIPEHLSKVGMVSGTALFTELGLVENVNEGTRRYMNLPREKPWAARLFLWLMGATARFAPGKFIANAASVLPEPDREVLSDPEIQKGFLALIQGALRQGVRGAFHESLLAIMNWGFGLQDIQAPVLIWHGDADQNVPVAMARYAEAANPKKQSSNLVFGLPL